MKRSGLACKQFSLHRLGFLVKKDVEVQERWRGAADSAVQEGWEVQQRSAGSHCSVRATHWGLLVLSLGLCMGWLSAWGS